MKKAFSALAAASLALALCACGATGSSSTSTASQAATSTASPSTTGTSTVSSPESASTAQSGGTESVSTATAATDASVTADETNTVFSFASEDGTFVEENGVYTITSAGTFVATGRLYGQIVIDAGHASDVVLELKETTISYDKDSPIKVLSADDVDISAKKGTDNVINDNRSAKTASDESQGEGAIYAKSDLKIKGTGTLVVNAGYNNGIHTTKDLEIQKLSLKANAVNCALRGDDSITVESGTVVAISTNGDGMKTSNTDVNNSGETRGDISILGGSMAVYAAGDGLQAAHNFEMATGEAGTAPAVTVYTGSYSGYTASDADTTSYKGVKAENELTVASGILSIFSYDDGLHANAGEAFDDGSTGSGNIHILGGSINMGVYATDTATAGGMMGPKGFAGQKTASGADAIHADGELDISGGSIQIDSAHEGLEANIVNISGGETHVSANDDCVNATKGTSTPQINVTGGFLEVNSPANGDVDGIDSNGNYTQTGGIVLAKGPNSEMAGAIDADGVIEVTGGTLIVLGYGDVTTGGNVTTYSLSLHEAGEHTVTIDGKAYTFTNATAYAQTACYSDVAVG